MCPGPTALLGFVLCLGWTVGVREGSLPRPSISAEPGSVIPQGQPVTIVCRGPAGAESFRLETESGHTHFRDETNVSLPGQSGTEARFPIEAVSGHTARRYHCLYHVRSQGWSERSESLELVVTGPTQTPVHDSGHGGLKPEYLPAVLGVSAVFLLGLLLLGLVLLHRKHQKKSGPPGRRDEEQRPQQRPRPAADVPAPERTPEVATVDRLPETDRQTDTPPPTAESPEEVTYAQLDHKVLTQGAALAVSPQSREPTTEFSTYAALSRR
ncbi:leukocyte-associated immunoglobulin-like receptor 1 isoform X2 [Tupaia chinensis]|uniref:leukocyte-associated immunoglobulin-like receptor 1 isoform X2 n=1 Tax=Tupaia chinensis TaxID=246437 RepID=UPI000703D61B|nr:leukocyte-associated immunoglobulin-like receptor 1 isoform X2 [Tupaia chinensis]